MPTTLSFASTGERRDLAAGLAFLEHSASGRWDIQGLAAWFEENLVETGTMARPAMVNEPGAGSIPLRPSGAVMGLVEQSIQRVVLASRSRVVDALRGLLAAPADDRFLAGAIFAGRVKRRKVGAASAWAAQPEPTASLSSIVLCLFAADILTHRELYDRTLCVCNVCGRVSFEHASGARRSCRDHPPNVSGFHPRVAGSLDEG